MSREGPGRAVADSARPLPGIGMDRARWIADPRGESRREAPRSKSCIGNDRRLATGERGLRMALLLSAPGNHLSYGPVQRPVSPEAILPVRPLGCAGWRFGPHLAARWLVLADLLIQSGYRGSASPA